MRIPAEILLPYQNESDRFAENPGTPPVGDSARLPSELPEGFPKPRQAQALPEQDERAAPGQANTAERRHDDRRKKQMPVTLDTRLTRSRRTSTSPAPIRIAI